METLNKIPEAMKTEYFHTISYSHERNGDYEMQEAISERWEYIKTDVSVLSCNGNLASMLKYNPEKKKMQMDKNYSSDFLIPTYKLMPSCLLLYKLIQVFKEMPTDAMNDWYKVTWGYPIRHKETGEFVIFGEFKAACSYWTKDKPSKPFLRDLIQLIEFLVTDKVAHTYDSVSAGSIA